MICCGSKVGNMRNIILLFYIYNKYQINIDINGMQTSSFEISWWWGVIDTTLYDKVCQ